MQAFMSWTVWLFPTQTCLWVHLRYAQTKVASFSSVIIFIVLMWPENCTIKSFIMNTHANIQHHHLLIKINSNTAASGVLYVFLMVMAFMEASASPCWCTTAIAYARKASQSYFCRFPLSSPCPHAASSEVVVLLLRGLMWYHISAVC